MPTAQQGRSTFRVHCQRCFRTALGNQPAAVRLQQCQVGIHIVRGLRILQELEEPRRPSLALGSHGKHLLWVASLRWRANVAVQATLVRCKAGVAPTQRPQGRKQVGG